MCDSHRASVSDFLRTAMLGHEGVVHHLTRQRATPELGACLDALFKPGSWLLSHYLFLSLLLLASP